MDTHTYTHIHTHRTTTVTLARACAPRINKYKNFGQGKLIHSCYNFEEPRKISKHNIIKMFQYSVHQSGTHKHAVIHQLRKTKSDFVQQRTAVL